MELASRLKRVMEIESPDDRKKALRSLFERVESYEIAAMAADPANDELTMDVMMQEGSSPKGRDPIFKHYPLLEALDKSSAVEEAVLSAVLRQWGTMSKAKRHELAGLLNAEIVGFTGACLLLRNGDFLMADGISEMGSFLARLASRHDGALRSYEKKLWRKWKR